MLYLIGLGLNDEYDITMRGLELVRGCSEVLLEAYTSVLTVPVERLEALYGRKVTVAERDFVESGIEPVLERAKTNEIALLVVGDPFGATTHCDVLARAKTMGVPVRVVHNASILNAIGCCGVQLYRFGEAVSVPFFTETWRPASFYEKLEANLSLGLHSLVLVDIKTREPTLPSLARGRPVYLPPRFMTVRQAAMQILETAAARAGATAIGPTSAAIGVARVGTESQLCVHGRLDQLLTVDFGPPLHSMVLLGSMTDVETDLVGTFCVEAASARHFTPKELEQIDAAAERAARAHETGHIEEDQPSISDEPPDETPLLAAPAARDGGTPAPAVETALRVAGMVSQADAERLKGALLALAGVRSVAVDLQAGLVKVSGAPGFPAARVMIEAAASAGYAATERRLAGGMFKFDPSEVDVEGGAATAEDFLDAFGF